MKRFAALYDAIDGTTSTNAKVSAMVTYFSRKRLQPTRPGPSIS